MLKKLKSLFIVEEEVPLKKASIGPKEESNPVPEVKLDDVPINKSAKAPEKFINRLLKAIDDQNMEGFDYLEYKQSLKSLTGMDMDEATRFASAYAMAKTMGASKENLLSSAKHYQKVIEDEKLKFDQAYQAQREKQIKTRKQRLSNIEQNIAKKESQIKKLEDEIKKLKSEFESKKNDLKGAEQKISVTRDQFYAAHDKVLEQIVRDIEKMNKFLNK